MQVTERDMNLLTKILEYCKDIEDTHEEYGNDYDTFCEKHTYRNAIALCIMQIGELTNKLSQDFKDENKEIPWKAIRGMRNIVAHEYGSIDTETIWESSVKDRQALEDFCRRYVDQEENFDMQMM